MTDQMETTLVDSTAGDFDLGKWLGRRQAFGLIAGRCSASEAECIRRIRNHRLYKTRAIQWGDFCESELGMSKTSADRIIRLLEEFGPAYFDVAQLTRITPDQYRAIAPSITEDGVCLNGETIAITPENSERVANAVNSLCLALIPETPPPASPEERLLGLERHCRRIFEELREISRANPGPYPELVNTLSRLQEDVIRLTLEIAP